MGDAERGMMLWQLRALGLLRAAQMLPWLSVAVAGRWETYHQPALVVSLYILDLCWAVVLFARALARHSLSHAWIAADTAVTTACVYLVGHACRPGYATTWQNWTMGPAMGAAILATIYWGRTAGAVSGAVICFVYAVAVWPDVSGTPNGAGAMLGNLGSLVGFTVAAGLVAARLRMSSRRADEAAAAALVAQRAQAVAEARFDERTRQYRLLHDTVLSTLGAIARGGLDHRTAEVRRRCARDAEFLRGLISAASDASPAGLNAVLAVAGHDQAALGLRIHHSNDAVPHQLPAGVVEAIGQTATEALNNVAKHAATAEAWITATGSPDGNVTVTVVDRGRGFDPLAAAEGFGITQSMRQRMGEIGGSVTVDSEPGQGTCVEIKWPA